MTVGLHLEILWADEDIVELSVAAGNGRFRGVADCYIGPDELAQLAAALRHFPTSSLDRREAVLGTFRPDTAGGGVRLSCRCMDSVGHVEVHVAIQDGSGPAAQTASFSFLAEPAAIDAFVAQLADAQAITGTVASLKGAT